MIKWMGKQQNPVYIISMFSIVLKNLWPIAVNVHQICFALVLVWDSIGSVPTALSFNTVSYSVVNNLIQ